MPVEIDDPAAALKEMFESSGWRYVARPAIEHRIAWLTERLVINDHWTLEKVRETQVQIKLLRLMLSNKAEFFTFGLDEPAT